MIEDLKKNISKYFCYSLTNFNAFSQLAAFVTFIYKQNTYNFWPVSIYL